MHLAIKTTSIYSHELQLKALIEGAVYESIYKLNAGQQDTRIQQRLTSEGFDISIGEAQSLTDLNAATLAQIEKLLVNIGISAHETLAERIVDYRDRDDESPKGENESNIYRDAGASYDPKNSEFQHVLELGQIPGMPADIVAKLSEHFTLFGTARDGRVITLRVAKTHGSMRATANVTVRLLGGIANTYKILNWDWTAS